MFLLIPTLVMENWQIHPCCHLIRIHTSATDHVSLPYIQIDSLCWESQYKLWLLLACSLCRLQMYSKKQDQCSKDNRTRLFCKPASLSKPAIYQERDRSSLTQPLISGRKFVILVLDFLSTCFSKTIFPSGNVSLQPLFGWRCKYLGTHRFEIYIHICWNIYHLLFKVKSIDYRKQVLYHFLSNAKLKTAESLQDFSCLWVSCSIITPLRLKLQRRDRPLQRLLIPARAPGAFVLQWTLKQRPQTNEMQLYSAGALIRWW